MNTFLEYMSEETKPPLNVVVNVTVSNPDMTETAQAGLSVTLRENELHLVQEAMSVLFASAINQLHQKEARREEVEK